MSLERVRYLLEIECGTTLSAREFRALVTPFIAPGAAPGSMPRLDAAALAAVLCGAHSDGRLHIDEQAAAARMAATSTLRQTAQPDSTVGVSAIDDEERGCVSHMADRRPTVVAELLHELEAAAAASAAAEADASEDSPIAKEVSSSPPAEDGDATPADAAAEPEPDALLSALRRMGSGGVSPLRAIYDKCRRRETSATLQSTLRPGILSLKDFTAACGSVGSEPAVASADLSALAEVSTPGLIDWRAALSSLTLTAAEVYDDAQAAGKAGVPLLSLVVNLALLPLLPLRFLQRLTCGRRRGHKVAGQEEAIELLAAHCFSPFLRFKRAVTAKGVPPTDAAQRELGVELTPAEVSAVRDHVADGGVESIVRMLAVQLQYSSQQYQNHCR